ncbi:aldose epimerase family protein [Chitinophaga sp. S165]|uniref:aldose epimerase family protein n=1 Tax=Chitinophaga sp. S165 TaxID=2135462 RepID=UPI000D71A859|nr:aldose epimerase family protein [Chitinophaga sp. S165]PWV55672.1 aldose 1-epimerase [Chitinophaga sp. S165]
MLNINSRALSATRQLYGELRGAPLYLITLENSAVRVELINLGATITAVYAPDKAGIQKNIVAGFARPEDYLHNPAYFGSTVGRYANRIAEGRITVNGTPYQLPVNNDGNHLHGGFEGFHAKVWEVTQCSDTSGEASVTMEYVSADGEEGYPGNLAVQVQYVLDDTNQLSIRYTATTDKATPVSLTNHSYFNLSGFEQPLVTDHLLTINAQAYTEKSSKNVPTGNILPVAGSSLDFTTPTKIGQNIDSFPADMGYDHNFVLQASGKTPAAVLEDPQSGRVLRVFTDLPGIQMYSSNYWDGSITGQQGKPYVKHGAVALEAQAFPDSPNHAHFPDTILQPGNVYQQIIIFAFDVQ